MSLNNEQLGRIHRAFQKPGMEGQHDTLTIIVNPQQLDCLDTNQKVVSFYDMRFQSGPHDTVLRLTLYSDYSYRVATSACANTPEAIHTYARAAAFLKETSLTFRE